MRGVYGCCLQALVMIGGMTGHDPPPHEPHEQAAAEPGIPPAGKWNLVVAASDEFDGSALDAAKWKKGLWYDVSGVLAFRPENIAVSGGNLVLTARKAAWNGRSHTCGAVESRFDVPGADSYVEIRARALHRDANVLSAIWLQSSPLTVASNPNPEIDIQETFNYQGVASTLHTWAIDPAEPSPTVPEDYIHTQTPLHEFRAGVDVSADFHVYGLERSNGKLRFYFDGRLAWEVAPTEPSYVNMPRHVVLSLEGHLGDPDDRHLPQDFLVDYVRTYVPAAD